MDHLSRIFRWMIVAVLLALFTMQTALADPPSRVARSSYVNGELIFLPPMQEILALSKQEIAPPRPEPVEPSLPPNEPPPKPMPEPAPMPSPEPVPAPPIPKAPLPGNPGGPNVPGANMDSLDMPSD